METVSRPFMPSMPASSRAHFDQSSFKGKPPSPGVELSCQGWRRYTRELSQLEPRAEPPQRTAIPAYPWNIPIRNERFVASANRAQAEEVSIVAPRHGSPPRLNSFIARMEESLSSDSSWINEAPTLPITPPTTPPNSPSPVLGSPSPPLRTFILALPRAAEVIDQANGFATSAPERRKVVIRRKGSRPSDSRPVLTVYDTLVRMRQDAIDAQASHVDCANGSVSRPAERRGTAEPRPHGPNHRHPSPAAFHEPPPAQLSLLTRANIVPWFSAQGIDLRPEETQVLDEFLASREDSPASPPSPPWANPFLTPSQSPATPPWSSPPRIRAAEVSPSPSPPPRQQITIASMLAVRENPLLEPLRSQLFMLEQAGLGDMEFDGGVATELCGICPFWSS